MAHGWKYQQTSVDHSPTGEIVLVDLDAYSKYPEVEIVSSTAARNALPALERIFATHGIPEVLKTDNGPPFQGQAFHEFEVEKGLTTENNTFMAGG